MKNYLLFPLLLCGSMAFGQLNERFTDGNFTANPAWTGSNSGNDFSIDTTGNFQLRSKSTTTNHNFYLSTANALASNCTWEFTVKLLFNPSSANYVDVYLSSDQGNLQSTTINGYFLRLGGTNDEICLFKRSGSAASSIKLIDGVNGILNTSDNRIKVRVTRTSAYQFTLERDMTGSGTSYVTEGSFVDSSFTRSAHFGIFIQQSTSSFHHKHWFDDVIIKALITDTTPPAMVSATVIDSTTLEVAFDEPIDSVSAKIPGNYSVNQHLGHPASVKTTSDAAKFILKFSKGFDTASYLLTASNITDKSGNVISEGDTGLFSFIKPYIPQKGDIVINEIFADPSPQIDLPSVEFIEIYNASTQTVSLKNWKYSDPVSTVTLPAESIQAGEYIILCARSDTNEYKRFGKTIGLSPWPSLNNSADILKLLSSENKTIDSVAYFDTWYASATKKLGGWSLERINPSSICMGLFNWTASKESSGGTPGRQNAAFVANYDQLDFAADSIKQLSDTTFRIYFNKPADVSTANNAFSLHPAPSGIKSVIFDALSREATISLNGLQPNTGYQISISSLKDCAGNIVGERSFQFTTPKAPPIRLDTARIFISEIFADPSPEIKLPLVEFVEIYNPGQDTIDLDGWTFANSKIKTTIKGAYILPAEYLILCPATDSSQYRPWARVIGLSGWPTLNNTADQVTLKSFKGRLIDSIAYSNTWHLSSFKKQGGWSLERIDHTSACAGMFNWTSAIDTAGGTPGKQNSVYNSNYDKLDLTMDSIRRLSDSTINLYLNKPVDLPASLGTFSLLPATANIKFSLAANLKQISLSFDRPLLPNTYYQMAISGLKDCAGNQLSTEYKFTTAKAPPIRPDTSQLYITEIFADPSPEVELPLVEFVEICNPGKDTIDLDGYTLGNSKTTAIMKNTFISPYEYIILCPIADTAQFKPMGKVAGIPSWPSLLNGGDRISIKSFKGRLLDSVSYADTWHTSTFKKQGGWSLERVDYQSLCRGAFNWTSSRDKSGGTPGKQNSVHIDKYDHITFKADSLKLLSDTSIRVYFNKLAELSSAKNEFRINPATSEIKSVSFDAQASRATLIFKQKLSPGTSYQLSVSVLKDCAGNIISPVTLSFNTPRPATPRSDTSKIFITEILADPSPEVKLPLVEFIELYNPGKDTADLDGWVFANSKTKALLKNISVLPGQYLILCPITDTAQYKDFGQVKGISPWPSLLNTADQLTLKSFSGRLVDTLAYFDVWHSNSVKKQGGWSLERIDHQSLCSEAFNWASSLDANGGTPGKQNSVHVSNYDGIAFKTDSVKQRSDVSVEVYFNKHADSSTLTGAFSLSPAIDIKSVSLDSKATKATLVFKEKFTANTSYQLSVSGLKDCAGKFITSSTSLSFQTPKLPPVRLDTATLYFTEIFADPSPEVMLPLVEFVEIFNPGKDTVNLDGWTFNDTSTKGILKSAVILPKQYIILCPEADTLQYNKIGRAIGITPWPSLNNSSDQITLKSFKNRLVDSVSYQASWYKNNTKKAGGWSLELIDRESVCKGIQNWTASIDTMGGSPGKQNSVYKLFNTSEPLGVTGATLKDSTTIIVSFNKPADSVFLSKQENYQLNNGVGQPTAVSLNSAFNEAELKFNQSITRGNSYRVTCLNISDCAGTTISATKNFGEFFYPHKISKGDIMISEILFNPRTGGADFLEIYNHSNNVLDLKELSVATIKAPDSIVSRKDVSATGLLFHPKQYLVLTIDPENIKKEYQLAQSDAFLRMSSMPAFNNDQGCAVLMSGKSRIDQLNYTEKMHFPLIKDPKGVSLERTNFKLPTNEPGNFRSAAGSSGYATPGYKNSQWAPEMDVSSEEVTLLSKTFSPDNDGFEDALHINYRFKEAGMVANASIYNDRGLLVKRLTKNTTLAAEGTIIWDGMMENELRAPIGIYIVYFDVFSLDGQTKKYKKACVLASKLN